MSSTDASAPLLKVENLSVAFRGRAEPDGAFLADTSSGQDAGGNTLVVVLSGRFHVTGFDTTIAVTQTPPASAGGAQGCSYAIAWTGTRRPAPTADGAATHATGRFP